MGGKAWVTLATNDSYSLGALVLAHSLKQVGSQYDLVVLVTPGVTGTMRQKLASIFNLVQGVNILDSKDEANLRLLKRPELGVTFTKLHCWRLTQYEKCVFLDADTMVLQNCDELFEREELSAAPDVGWPDCFNSGVFVYRPSLETYEKLIQFALEKGSFDGGDQGLLNLYFSDWAHKDISKHLPFIYNMCSTACYSYLPAYKQFGSDAKIVHFIGYTKPWLQYFDSESRTVRPSGAVEHLTNVLQRWWDIFCSFIHQSLSQDMARSNSDAVCTSSPHTISTTPVHNYKNVRDPWEEYDKRQQQIVQREDTSSEEAIAWQAPNIITSMPFESHNTNAYAVSSTQTPPNSPQHEEPANHYEAPIVNTPHFPHDAQKDLQPQNTEGSSFLHPDIKDNTQKTADNFETDPIPQSIQAFTHPCDQIISDQATSYQAFREQEHSRDPQTHFYNQPDIHFCDQPIPEYHSCDQLVPESRSCDQPIPKSHSCDPLISEFRSCDQTILEPPNRTSQCESTGLEAKNANAQGTEIYGGLAGAFARMTLGAPKSPEQIALEDSLRRQGWEVGNIDYLGRDSFDNIWSKICETLSASQPETPKQELAPAETDSQTPKVPPVEASTKSDVQEPQSPVIPLPSPDAKVQATEEDASKIAPSQQVLEQPIQPIDEAVKVPEACPLPKSADEKCSLEKPTTELPIEEKSISECPETTKIESESKPLEGAEVQVTSVTEIKGQEPAVLQPSCAEQISASVEVDTKDKTSTDISLPVQTDQAACQLTQASPTQPQSSETLPATPTTETSAPQIPSTPPTTTPSQTPTTPPAAAPVTPPTTPSQTPVTPPATIPATSPTKTPPDAPAAKPETAPTPETPAAVIEQPQTPVVESQEPMSIVQETSAQPQSPQSTSEAAKVIVPPTESAPKETPAAEPAPPSIKPEEKIQTAEKPKVEEKVTKPEEKETKVEIAQEAVEAVKLDEQSKPEEKGKIIKTEGAVKPEGKTTSEEKAQEVTKSDEKCVKPEEKTIKLEEDKSDKSEAKPEETSTKTKDKAAEAEDKAAKVEDKAAKVEDKAPKPEGKAAKAEDKAANAEDKTVKTEDKAANAQDKAAKVEDKAGKTEDKAVKAEGKAAKTDDKAAKAEGKTSKPDDKQGKSEEKAATSEGAAPSAAAATPTPPPRKGSGGNKKTGKSKK